MEPRLRRLALIGLGVVLVVAAVLVSSASSGEAARAVKATSRPPVRIVEVSDYRTTARTDTEAIQAAIEAAGRGATVRFEPGVYQLDRPIRFASEVNYVGSDGDPTILRSSDPAGLMIVHDATTPVHDITLRGIEFDNVRLRFSGDDTYESFTDITLTDCVFRNGAVSAQWMDAYIALVYTDGVTIDGCQFLRDRNHGGRGVTADKTRFTVVKDSYFGTTPNLEAGTPNGFFRNAITVAGHELSTSTGSRETVVDGNVWRRTPNAAQLGNCANCQDHGLYAWGTQALFVVGNRADGWDASSAGGAMKLRNQEDTFVLRNQLQSSGILTYVYDSPTMPHHLNRIFISDNTINLAGSSSSCVTYCGINYWRNFVGDGDGSYESDVYIKGNTFSDGGSITLVKGHGPAFCAEDNANAQLDFRTTGVKTARCGVPPSWNRPLAGVHRGDFNGDGIADFVQEVRDDDGESRWRAHLSSGDGFVNADWGGGAYTSPRTDSYGVQVGDFDGDGRDDLTYAGYCGQREPCWRTHLSIGNGFAEPVNWGYHVYPSDETERFGFHVGDFNGDGRDDLVFRGNCREAEACWRQLVSDGDRFEVRFAGDGARWSDVDDSDFGILVGDYDGDGRDDLAYRGVCEAKAKPCFRVQLSTDDGFSANDWGGRGYFVGTGVTEHFGMRVGDRNGDGRADIGYLGRCGSDGAVQWRYHTSTGSGFEIRCSAAFGFSG